MERHREKLRREDERDKIRQDSLLQMQIVRESRGGGD